MRLDFDFSSEERILAVCLKPRRLAHDGVAQFVFEHGPFALETEPIELAGRADPARSIRSDKLNVAVDSRRVQEAESRGVEREKPAGPAGAQVEIDGVETDGGFVVIADANGKRLGDRAIGEAKG